MNRRWARASLVGSVVVALIALGYVLGQTLQSRRQPEHASDLGMLPDVSQRITDFRRVKVRDGRKVWELHASEAQYFEDQEKVLVRNPEVSFFDEQGDIIRVTGREGRLFLKSKDLERIELSGGVEVKMQDYVLRTEEATYDHEKDLVVSPGKVEVSSSTMSVAGELMILLLKTQTVQLLKNVTTTFQRGAGTGPAIPSVKAAAATAGAAAAAGRSKPDGEAHAPEP